MKNQRKNKQIDPNNAGREDGLKTITQTNVPSAEDRIRQRAYEIHQAHGGAPGQELDDWLQAEREFLAEQERPVGPGEQAGAAGDGGSPPPFPRD